MSKRQSIAKTHVIFATHADIGRLCGVAGRWGRNGIHLVKGETYTFSTLSHLARHLPNKDERLAQRWLDARKKAWKVSRLSPEALDAYRAKVKEYKTEIKQYLNSLEA